MDELIKAIRERETISVTGLGTFKPVTRAARTAHNIKTGKPIEIPEHQGVKFKASKKLFKK